MNRIALMATTLLLSAGSALAQPSATLELTPEQETKDFDWRPICRGVANLVLVLPHPSQGMLDAHTFRREKRGPIIFRIIDCHAVGSELAASVQARANEFAS